MPGPVRCSYRTGRPTQKATVKLITGAMSRVAADKRLGRAEAMRQSMLALIDGAKPYEAHPFFWAPFVVVGEGGVSRQQIHISNPHAEQAPARTGALFETMPTLV